MCNSVVKTQLTKEQRYEIAESLAGSCDATINVEFFQKEMGFSDEVAEELEWDTSEICAEFDLYRCEDCGWWGDIGDMGECDDCGGDLV